MKVYHKDGICSNVQYVLTDTNEFTIQFDDFGGNSVISYTNDTLVKDVESKLLNLYYCFRDLYFPDTEKYYRELSVLPIGLHVGGQSSELPINKDWFLKIKESFDGNNLNLSKHIYLGDCEFLVSTVQNLIQSIEYCFVQYFVQISQVNLPNGVMLEDAIYDICSSQSMQLMFLLETFFTKMYTVLDLMVKIVYELEHPNHSIQSMKKLKSAEMLWGDRKKISLNNMSNTIFEDSIITRQIEAIRNEAVHNGSWEIRPRVFLKVENGVVINRFMLFPDFEDGRLATVKNRRHFFSTETKVNDVLVTIHDEFHQRLLETLKHIIGHQTTKVQLECGDK